MKKIENDLSIGEKIRGDDKSNEVNLHLKDLRKDFQKCFVFIVRNKSKKEIQFLYDYYSYFSDDFKYIINYIKSTDEFDFSSIKYNILNNNSIEKLVKLALEGYIDTCKLQPDITKPVFNELKKKIENEVRRKKIKEETIKISKKVLNGENITREEALRLVHEKKEIEPDYKREDSEELQLLFNSCPQIIKDIFYSLQKENKILNKEILFFQALSIFQAAISKNVKIKNQGSEFFGNGWYLCLAESGSNKTSVNSSTRKIDEINDDLIFLKKYHSIKIDTVAGVSTMSSLLETIGETFNSKEFKNKNRYERNLEVLQKKNETEHFRKAYLFVNDEVTQALDTLISNGGDKKTKLAILLSLFDGLNDIEDNTVMGGKRIVFDPCFNIFGLTQPNVFAETFGGDFYKESGLLQRFFVVEPGQFDFNPKINDVDFSFSDKIHELYENINEKYEYNINNFFSSKMNEKYNKNIHDIVGFVADLVYNKNKKIQEYKKKGILDNSYRSKAIVSSLRFICCCMAFDGIKQSEQSGKMDIDRKYIKMLARYMECFLLSHLNSEDQNIKNADNKAKQRIIAILNQQKKSMTAGLISSKCVYKSGRRLGAKDLYPILDDLEEAGKIIKIEGERVPKFCLNT